MLNDFTGGGQIFLHKLRMFWQVLGRSFWVASMASITILVASCYSEVKTFDLAAAISYQKAVIGDNIDDAFSIMRSKTNPNSKGYFITIDAYTKDGLYAKDIDPRKIINSKQFKEANSKLIAFLQVKFLICLAFIVCIFLFIYGAWSKFGRDAKEKKLLSGHTIKAPKEVAKILKSKKMASDFVIGGVPLIKDSETKHILITGSTGSGKTNCLHTLLPQVRAKKQPAIILDTEGDMVARYFRPDKDIIINPFDVRSHTWDFWDEIRSNKDIRKIANSFFPDSPPDSHDYDKKWTSWGKMLFVGCLEYLRNENKATIENLYNLIHRDTIESITQKLKNTSVASLLSSKSENNSAPHNIRINTLLATEWLEFITDSKDNPFSFAKWFKELDATKDDRWIFITCDGADAKVLLPFFNVITDIALNALVSLGINRERRVWFVFDELAKLKYLPALQENITILRKYGGAILAATQSFNQIFAHYGKNSGSVMLGQFNTNIIFRISEVEEAKIIARRIGEIEYLTQQKNISYGAHEFRDGISYTEQEKRQDLIKINDLGSLKEHEGYIFLPDPEVAISKTKLEIAPKPPVLQPAFVNNPLVEDMIEERQRAWQEREVVPKVEQAEEDETNVVQENEEDNEKENFLF